jgi:hypothetical protein
MKCPYCRRVGEPIRYLGEPQIDKCPRCGSKKLKQTGPVVFCEGCKGHIPLEEFETELGQLIETIIYHPKKGTICCPSGVKTRPRVVKLVDLLELDDDNGHPVHCRRCDKLIETYKQQPLLWLRADNPYGMKPEGRTRHKQLAMEDGTPINMFYCPKHREVTVTEIRHIKHRDGSLEKRPMYWSLCLLPVLPQS